MQWEVIIVTPSENKIQFKIIFMGMYILSCLLISFVTKRPSSPELAGIHNG